MLLEWKGIFPALTTPFTLDDELDLAMFENNLKTQLEAGVNGIILGGSLGEASVLTTREKETLVRFAVEKVEKKIPVILNIAEGSTKDALKQVAYAKAWRADGLMLLPPMRYRSDHRETVQYLKTIANSTDLPIMIYNNPVDYGIEVTLDMFEELVDCKNIQAVKDSTRDLNNVTGMNKRFGERIKILCGVDTIAMQELYMGADGWVAGLVNAFPKETVAIYRLVKTGQMEEASAINRWFMPLLELDVHSKLVQYIKLAAAQVGLGTEYVRAPRLILEGEERSRILKIINDGIERRPALPELVATVDSNKE
jgi:1-pyrroline-4-hydroxy-2-carboxylate deaminase